MGGVSEDARVVLPHLKRLPGKVSGLAAGCLRIFGSSVNDETQMADRRPRKCRPVVVIDRERLSKQSQSLDNPLFRYRKEDRKRAQVEVVGGEIGRLPRGG